MQVESIETGDTVTMILVEHEEFYKMFYAAIFSISNIKLLVLLD